MTFTIADQYFMRARDGYPYNMDEVLENLQYALSYDQEHANAHHLMGLVYLDQLNDAEQAEAHFQQALAAEPRHAETCLDFIRLMVSQRQFAQADRLLNYAATISGLDMARLYFHRGMWYEYQRNYAQALHWFRQAMAESYNGEMTHYLETAIERVWHKMQQAPAYNVNIA